MGPDKRALTISIFSFSGLYTTYPPTNPPILVLICAECLRDLPDVVKADDSNLYLCGLCHEKERVHWKILLSTDMEEQAFLANTLRVIERAELSRPKDYGRTPRTQR